MGVRGVSPFNGSGPAVPFYGSGTAAPFNGSGTAAPFNGRRPVPPSLFIQKHYAKSGTFGFQNELRKS